MHSIKNLLLAMMLVSGVMAQDMMPKTLENQALKVINKFIKITQSHSYENSAKMVVPLMHRSLLERSQKSLDSDTYRYQFKKAQSNAKHYAYPVKVTHIQKLKTTEIGHPSVGTYEKGVEYKLWIAKKKSVEGVPAPIVLFFNEAEDVKLSYVGSL